MVQIFRFLTLTFLLFSCSDKKLGVIHWASQFDNLERQQKYADSLGLNTPWMVRYFDVVWKNNRTEPAAIAILPNSLKPKAAAIFIQRQALENTASNQLPQFAQKIVSLLSKLEENRAPAQDLLLDFDWGKNTKEKYFKLISLLKKQLPNKRIGATIRLSQFANPNKYGIPPAHYGLLMMYQTGSIKNPNQPIMWEKLEVEKYLQKTSYPLALDVGIPTFSWAVLQRKGSDPGTTKITLLFPAHLQQLQTDKHFKQTQTNTFVCLEPHFFHGHFLLPGDQLRCEKVSENDLQWALKKAKSITKDQGITYLYLIEEASNGSYPTDWFQ